MRRGRVDMEISEIPAERQVLFLRQRLVAEENDAVLGQGAVDLVHLMVRQRRRQVRTANFRPDDRGQFVDGDCFIRCRVVGGMTIAGAVVAAQRAHGGGTLSRWTFGRIIRLGRVIRKSFVRDQLASQPDIASARPSPACFTPEYCLCLS